MSIISKDDAFLEFKKVGSNSSHFVWFLANLVFFKSSEGYVFGYVKKRGVTLLALEPLIPADRPSFKKAWDEFVEAVKPEISVFISIYEPFFREIQTLGFQGFSVGSEPWIRLTESVAKGNAGRGVRSARNQAIRAGLVVEEWSSAELSADLERRKILASIYEDWSSPQWLRLNGFTLASDPFVHMEIRRYFILRSRTGVEAYLVASPVPFTQSFYLEDIIIRREAPRGAGELLTLEALAALGESGGNEASLGVVALSKCGKGDDGKSLPWAVRFLVVTLPNALRAFYNFEGQEIYRKRFKPHRWAPVYLAVHKSPKISQGHLVVWLRVLVALLASFEPSLELKPATLLKPIYRFIRNYSLTLAIGLVSLVTFALVNHWGDLPKSVLAEYGFSGADPFHEWPVRTVVSDFLYLNSFHFYSCMFVLVAVVAWAERTRKRYFVAALLLLNFFLDDPIDYVFLHLPFREFRPEVFHRLLVTKDVGGSLIAALFLGLQLTRLRRLREVLLISLSFFLILGIALNAEHLSNLVVNLNHVLFLFIGYSIGKVTFELERRKSRRVAGGKTPTQATGR